MFRNARTNLKAYVIIARSLRQQQKYDAMIAASQAKLAETTLVPGYTKIYA
jgi:hypothetical protein